MTYDLTALRSSNRDQHDLADLLIREEGEEATEGTAPHSQVLWPEALSTAPDVADFQPPSLSKRK
jgi:hypothetical protein